MAKRSVLGKLNRVRDVDRLDSIGAVIIFLASATLTIISALSFPSDDSSKLLFTLAWAISLFTAVFGAVFLIYPVDFLNWWKLVFVISLSTFISTVLGLTPYLSQIVSDSSQRSFLAIGVWWLIVVFGWLSIRTVRK